MIPQKYIPKFLSKNNKVKQKKALTKSRKLYKKGIYYERPKIKSFKSKKSPHILKAQKIYNIKSLKPNKELEKKTKCSITGLKKILRLFRQFLGNLRYFFILMINLTHC